MPASMPEPITLISELAARNWTEIVVPGPFTDTAQDNSATFKNIVALTSTAPYFSRDGGMSWTLASVVPVVVGLAIVASDNGVTPGTARFAAVTENSSDLIHSPTGDVWTSAPLPDINDDTQSLGTVNGLWILAVVDSVTGTGKFYTSPDFAAYTLAFSEAGVNSNFGRRGIFNPTTGFFYTVDVGFTYRTADGVNFEKIANNISVGSVDIGADKIAVDNSGIMIVLFDNRAWRSVDGVVWTELTLPANGGGSWDRIAHNGFNLWLLAGQSGNLATSRDGSTFTRAPTVALGGGAGSAIFSILYTTPPNFADPVGRVEYRRWIMTTLTNVGISMSDVL